ncbi:2-phospho-L-lactate transferase [Gryllotalpicola sp.]|uniref:2-phospho-L-lactate transferase n=1 Tax=Gryllotalpicola sp. TaxID=1932787 RepID=UPI002621B138|nr:2-phospho-L-lactate transferase [Gryllotalpicola sp.]
MQSIVVLAGGVGGAKFVGGLVGELARRHPDASDRPAVKVIVNTGDDMWLTGLRVCPDLDSIMYALAGVNDAERGWGRAGESSRVSGELAAYGVGWPWFTLGDLDLGTHIARTALLRDGLTLTEATARLGARWHAGAGLPATLLPMSDDPVETHVRVTIDGDDALLHFEEWWVRLRAGIPAREFVQVGVESARPTPEVLAAVAAADLVLLAPSNPVVSIGTILGVPGMREALAAAPAPIVGVSPIIAGAAVRGMADSCLAAIGVETSALGVAGHYGARSTGGVLDAWLVAEEDAAAVPQVHALGIRSAAVPLWMRDAATSTALAGAALDAAGRQ